MTTLNELRELVKESIKEFNTNAVGGANQPIHVFSVPNKAPTSSEPAEVAVNVDDIANSIVVAIKHLVNPVAEADPESEESDGLSARRIEVERSRRVLQSWVGHEEALNAAAELAAETLTSSDITGISHSKDAGTLGY